MGVRSSSFSTFCVSLKNPACAGAERKKGKYSESAHSESPTTRSRSRPPAPSGNRRGAAAGWASQHEGAAEKTPREVMLGVGNCGQDV